MPLVAGGDELEEEVRGFWFEGDGADFVDDDQRTAAETSQLVVESSALWTNARRVDPDSAAAAKTT